MMMKTVMKAVFLGCVWVSVWPTWCVCFSRGANSASCVDMKPGHISAQPQHTHIQSAVTVHTSRTIYLPQQTLMVSVRSSRAFMGLLLQARSVPEDRVVGGEFTLNPPGTHTLSCISTADTVTHSDKLLKRNLSFTWRAPAQPSGDMRFYITVVHSYFVYWSRIRSAVVHDGTRRSAGYDGGLQTRIISASLLKPKDTQTHTSSALHLLNSAPSSAIYTNKSSPNTVPPQHTHTTQLSTTHSQPDIEKPSKVTQNTHKLDNSTSETSSSLHFHIASHTSSEILHEHTQTHTGLFKQFHTRPHPHTVSDKHTMAPPTPTHTEPQAHIHKHTLRPLQTHKYKTTPSTNTQGMTSHTHRSPLVTPHTHTTHTQQNSVTTARPHILTSPLTAYTHVVTMPTAYTPAHTHYGPASSPHPVAHLSPHRQVITVPSTRRQDSHLHSSTATSTTSSLNPLSIPTSTTISISISTSIPNSITTLTPASILIPTSTLISTPTPASILIPTSIPLSTPTPALILIPTSTPVSTPTPASILIPTSTLISTPTPASILIPTSTLISTPTPASILIPTSIPVSTPTPASILIPTSNPLSTPTLASILIPNSTPISGQHPASILIPSSTPASILVLTSNPLSTPTPPSIPTVTPTPTQILIPTTNLTIIPIPTLTSNSILVPTPTSISPTPPIISILTPTPIPNSTLIPISISSSIPTPTSISTLMPTKTSILTLSETATPTPTSIPYFTLIPTPMPVLTSIPTPSSTAIPIQTLKSIPTHMLTPTPLHTSTLPSSPHPDPSPALQRSLSNPLPPRESRDESDSHAQREEGSSEPKPPQRPRGPPRAPDGKGEKPELVPRQNASELGLLLVGVSAGLGMAVAVGLRYLQRKHCRRHTAVSLGDRSHGNRGVIHVQECGDLVQVRRIRENSFLLLQAEYNLITAPGS